MIQQCDVYRSLSFLMVLSDTLAQLGREINMSIFVLDREEHTQGRVEGR